MCTENEKKTDGVEHKSGLTVSVPHTVIAFLLGEGPLDGVWFGEKHPTEFGNFWWRKHLRQNAKNEGLTAPERKL